MAEGVDARVVLIAPSELQGVVSDLLDVAQDEVTAGHVIDGAPMTLAMRARTITAQDLMRQNAFVAICPLDLHDFRSMRSFDARRLDLGISCHVRLPLLACRG
jgi:hypothetical protein